MAALRLLTNSVRFPIETRPSRSVWRGLPLLGVLFAAWFAPHTGAAPTITKFPNSQTLAVGASVTLSVEATGTAPLSYQWYRGTTAIAGATSSTLTISNVQLADAGVYAVAVTDPTGTVRTFTGYSQAFAAGNYHSLFTKTDGTLWATGNNSSGQLGDGTNTSRFIPVNVATGVTAVAAGALHSVFVKSDGSLWGMGYNFNGQLGDGTTNNRNTPVQIVASGVVAIAAGSYHSLFLKSDGTLWAMGSNFYGQLGDGLGTSRSSPVQIAFDVQTIASGTNQSFFIKTDGSLWACGYNGNGQLGDGTTANRSTPVQVATGIIAVSSGINHTIFLRSDGTAWGMGSGSNGQLGNDSYNSRLLPVQIFSGVDAVVAGNFSSFFHKADNTLWACGYNNYGQFGDGTTMQRSAPTQVATGVATMRAGESYAFFLRSDGSLWASGYNSNGQLGDGSSASRITPLPVLVSTDTPAVLNIGFAPTLTSQPVSLAVNAGSIHALSVTAGGGTPLFYQWYKDGTAIPGATGSTFSIGSFSLDRVGAYTVTVTNSYGSVTSPTANLTIILPVVTPQIAVADKAVSLAATTGGAGTATWQLSTDGGTTWTTLTNSETYAGTDSLALRIPNVTRAMAHHLFRYQITSGSGVATSAPISITVIASPLEMPTALTLDRTSGRLYVTDAAAQTVLAVSTDLKLSVVAGRFGETGTANGPAASARFHEPSGLVLTGAGSLILADTSNSSIREINSGGAVSTYAGQSGSAGSIDGNTAAARFQAPLGLAADLSGNFLVTDQSDHTVRLIGGGMVQTLAGRVGIPGVADGQGTAASFNAPSGIAVRRDNFASISWNGGTNSYGTTFVADQGGHTIRTITSTGLVGTYAGLAGTPGFANGNRTSARFRQPAGLAFDSSGNLFVADTGNHVIRRIDVYGNVTTFAGSPGGGGLMDGTGAQAQFLHPEGVAVDAANNLYVADTGNGVLRMITPAGKVSTLLILGNVPTITTQPAGLSLTTGSSAAFSVGATGEGTLSYQWKKDGALIPGATSSTYSIASATAGHAGTYTVAVANNWGATESASATLAVTTPPPPPSGGGSNGSGGGGGGGAPTLPFLVLLGLMAAVRFLRQRSNV
ncbi:MAG: immunoglobulin domain-containing protein [Candidatus Didemnitutus sp.]|nr:immunoglobulin domain-containing protein [Candidatus Didemnitutus sp.]